MIRIMKILFVTDLYPIGNEKIAKALYYFVLEWKRQGHEVEVIRPNFCINTKIRKRKIIEEKIYYENGIKIYNLNFATPFLFNVYNKLPDGFSLKNYDVMISHMPCGALMAEKLLKKEKIKYICGVHCSDIAVLTKKIYSLFFKKRLTSAYLMSDKIAARSPILKKRIEEIIPEVKGRTFVAYSGVDDELVKDIERYNAKVLDFIYNKELSIVVCASLIKRKNVDVVIKGLSKFKSRNFFLRIIGDGEERSNLEKLTKDLGLEKNIKFLGEIKRDKVFSYLKKSTVFILLSQNETFGLSYLEAMAALNLIIASKNDGIDGILKDKENAFLISPDCVELEKCIENIISIGKEEAENIYKNMENTIKRYTISFAAANYLANIER